MCRRILRRWRLTNTIDVEIYGQRYAISGEADDDYVKRLARLSMTICSSGRRNEDGNALEAGRACRNQYCASVIRTRTET